MSMYLQNQPIVFNPNYLINPQYGKSADQYREWNFLFRQYKEFIENQNLIYRQTDLIQRRNLMSNCIPQDLVFFGNTPLLPNIWLDNEFNNVIHYVINETSINEECAALFICTHTLAASCGRYTVVDGDHHEASVIHALGIANSGQRKSAVHDRLCAPAMAFEEKLKAEHHAGSGVLSRKVINSLPRYHSKKILNNVDFSSVESVLKAVGEAKKLDEIYNDLIQKKGSAPNINVTDVTPFQLAKLMQENGDAQLMASSESGGLEKLLFNKNTELLLKSYGQEPYIYASAKAQIELPHPALNIVVFGQYITANKLYTSPSLCTRGQLSRIMPYINLNRQPIVYNNLRGDKDIIYKSKIIKLFEKFYTRDGNADRYIVKVDKIASDILHYFRGCLHRRFNKV